MLDVIDVRRNVRSKGLTRRAFIQAGALGVGLTLTDLLRLQASAAVLPGTAKKSVIMVYLNGGPSHVDMYDPKPAAPVEYRGEFMPIRTNVPGIETCELLPEQATHWRSNRAECRQFH